MPVRKGVGTALIKSPTYRRWMESEVRALRGAQSGGAPLITGPCFSIVQAFFPDRRKRDLDNVLKSVNDVLVQSRVLHDDSLITAQTAIREPYVRGERGRIEVLLCESLKDFETALKHAMEELRGEQDEPHGPQPKRKGRALASRSGEGQLREVSRV